MWTRDPNSNMADLMYAKGEELARVEARVDTIVRERSTLTVTELITDMEEEFGLPEIARSLSLTLEGRRNDLHAKLISVGGQHPEYFESIATSLGYTINIVEFTPAHAGILQAGQSCGNERNIFYWKVEVDVNGSKGAFDWAFDSLPFTSLPGNSFDYILSMIRKYPNLFYELNRLKPGHTLALYDWWQRSFDRGFGWAFECFPSYDGSVVSAGLDYAFDDSFGNNHDYDGEYLTGALDTGFNLSFDAHFGWDFYKREFDSAFTRPL
jgi:uncharacterized protein YmfQ (DUF2313 family)